MNSTHRIALEGKGGRRAHVLALVSLLACLTFYTVAVLRVDFHRTRLLDLDPTPDAVEYFAGAMSLYHGDGAAPVWTAVAGRAQPSSWSFY